MHHQWTCTADPSLTCPKGCGKVLSSKQSREVHAAKCTGQPRETSTSLVCTKGCGKTFSRVDSRRRHDAHCTGQATDDSLDCTKGCGKTFHRVDARRRHEARCSGPPTCPPPAGPPTCTRCDRVFSRPDALQRHLLICGVEKKKKKSTTPEAPPTCTRCGSIFSRPDTLQRHLRTCGVTFACSKGCGEEFATERKRAAHEAECRYTPRKYWCPVCPYKGYAHQHLYDWHAQQCKGLPSQSTPFKGTV